MQTYLPFGFVLLLVFDQELWTCSGLPMPLSHWTVLELSPQSYDSVSSEDVMLLMSSTETCCCCRLYCVQSREWWTA